MMDVRQRLESELRRTLARLRHATAAVPPEASAVMTLDESGSGDPLDLDPLAVDRELSFASRSLLFEKARRLARALERLDRGEYGLCQECGAAIPPRRLEVAPDALRCVRCQEELERRAAPGSREEAADAIAEAL